MAVYVDPLIDYGWVIRGKRYPSCHLFADTLAELFDFATRLGLKRQWLHVSRNGVPHFDLIPSKRALAIKLGALDAWADDELWARLESAKMALREEWRRYLAQTEPCRPEG